MNNENNLNLTEMIREIHDGVAREMYCKGIDDFAEKAIKIVYESNNRDRNPQPRDMVADIHYKLLEIKKQLKEQNK